MGRKIRMWQLLVTCYSLLLFMVFPLCNTATAEYALNQTIFQKVRYIEGKQEQIIKAVYTIKEIKETKSIGEGVFAKKADGKFIIVRFRVHNKSSNPIPSNILTDLVILDNKKNKDYLRVEKYKGMKTN